MKILAIIAEYNPMHNGHIYHLEKSKEVSKADFVVCVMSGNFTQRGEPAILNKWIRSQVAVENGVDLVVELPFPFACNSAEYFATGAMNIIKALGCVDLVSFGSESGDVEHLKEIADLLSCQPDQYKEGLRKHLDMGLSFPKARELAVNQCLGLSSGKLLQHPNNILAIEYLKACGPIETMTIKRIGDYHSTSIDQVYPSATGIRQEVLSGSMDNILSFMPVSGRNAIKSHGLELGDKNLIYPLIRTKILQDKPEELAQIFAVTEGLENKMKREVRRAETFDQLAMAVKSKRYTLAGINRIMIQTLMDFKKDDLYSYKPYARVLAFNEKGREIIRQARKSEDISIITNINKVAIPELMNYDILASDMYNLSLGKNLYDHSDYVMKPYMGK